MRRTTKKGAQGRHGPRSSDGRKGSIGQSKRTTNNIGFRCAWIFFHQGSPARGTRGSACPCAIIIRDRSAPHKSKRATSARRRHGVDGSAPPGFCERSRRTRLTRRRTCLGSRASRNLVMRPIRKRCPRQLTRRFMIALNQTGNSKMSLIGLYKRCRSRGYEPRRRRV
jgi:hypothetical protein